MNDQVIKVLIVDDEEDLAEIICDSLELVGLEASYVLSGQAALEKLKSPDGEGFAAVLSDYQMPEMNGEELLLNMKELNLEKDPLFYLCTGDIEVMESEIQDKGAAGLIPKPYAIDEVVKRLKQDIENNSG